MKSHSSLRVIISSILILGTSNLYPCAIYVLNNTQSKILLVDKNGSIAMILQPLENADQAQQTITDIANKAMEDSDGDMDYIIKQIPSQYTYFGNPKKHGYFRVMTSDFDKHPGHYAARVVVQQTACSKNHAIVIKASDILNQKVTTENQGIITIDPYTMNEQKEQQRLIKGKEATDQPEPAKSAALPTRAPRVMLAQSQYDPDFVHSGFPINAQLTRLTSGEIPHGDAFDGRSELTQPGMDPVPPIYHGKCVTCGQDVRIKPEPIQGRR